MRVLLTHSEGRLEGLGAALEALGFHVTHHPLVATELLPGAAVKEAAAALLGADWILFTSRTAVRAFEALGLPLTGAPKLGVVGEATAGELRRLHGRVALSAEPANAQGLLETFQTRVSPPARVGLPCGEGALPTLATGLVRAGFSVNQVHLYRTVPRPFVDANADLIVLASPSAVAALPESAASTLVTLGPSTHRAVRERGWHAVEAETPDVAGVVRAVLAAPHPLLETL